MKQLYDSPHTPLTLGTPKTLDFYKNLTTVQLFGHGVMLFNLDFIGGLLESP